LIKVDVAGKARDLSTRINLIRNLGSLKGSIRHKWPFRF
jgi:hypothetical protein